VGDHAVLGISILPLSMIFLLDFGTILTVLYFVNFLLLDFGTILTVLYFVNFHFIRLEWVIVV